MENGAIKGVNEAVRVLDSGDELEWSKFCVDYGKSPEYYIRDTVTALVEENEAMEAFIKGTLEGLKIRLDTVEQNQKIMDKVYSQVQTLLDSGASKDKG